MATLLMELPGAGISIDTDRQIVILTLPLQSWAAAASSLSLLPCQVSGGPSVPGGCRQYRSHVQSLRHQTGRAGRCVCSER